MKLCFITLKRGYDFVLKNVTTVHFLDDNFFFKLAVNNLYFIIFHENLPEKFT